MTMTFRRKLPVQTEPTSALPPADFQEFFNGFIDSTKKQWGHDRTKTLGGSEVFGCIRKAWYSRNGAPKDPDYKESWGATRRGDLIENYHVVPAMEWASKTFGFNIDYTGSDQQTLFCDGVPMSVTPDGLIHGIPRDWLKNYGIPDIKSDCVMFEIKSIDPRVDLSEEKSIHHGQTQIQMGLVRENTKFKPHYAVILYVNASFFDDMNVFVVEWDPKKYEVAKARAHAAYETEKPETLLREGNIDGSCQYCPFTRVCLESTVAGFPPEDDKKARKKGKSDPKLVEALAPLMQEAHAARAELKKATKHDGLVKEKVKAALRDFGARWAKDGEWSLSYSMTAGRKTVDNDKLLVALDEVQRLIEKAGLADELDAALKDIGVGEEGQNEPRRLEMEAFMKQGAPFEVLRMTFTEPDAEDL